MGWRDEYGLVKNKQVTTTNLRAYHCSDNLGVRTTTDLHGDLEYMWRLFVSFCNLNIITC